MRASFGFALLATICGLLAILCITEHRRDAAPLVKTAAQVQAPPLTMPVG